MSRIRTLSLLLLSWVALGAQDMSAFMPKSGPVAPALEPGEGLAIASEDGRVVVYGEAKKVAPMGSLAKLVWLRMNGDDWGAADVRFRCTGEWNGFTCWHRKGHGNVDLAKALEDSCNLAFLGWAAASTMQSKAEFGDDLTRARLEDVFGPFMGNRVRRGEPLPPFGPAWIGDGELFQTSPEAFARWLVDPAQERTMSQVRRLLLPFYKQNPGTPQWWMKTGTAPVPGQPGVTAAWVAGSDGGRAAVLYLPRGRGKAEGLTRFAQILGLPVKKR